MKDVIMNRSNSYKDYTIRWSLPTVYASSRRKFFKWKTKNIITDLDYSLKGQFQLFIVRHEDDPESSRFNSINNERDGKTVITVDDPFGLSSLVQPSQDQLRGVGIFRTHFAYAGKTYRIDEQ